MVDIASQKSHGRSVDSCVIRIADRVAPARFAVTGSVDVEGRLEMLLPARPICGRKRKVFVRAREQPQRFAIAEAFVAKAR